MTTLDLINFIKQGDEDSVRTLLDQDLTLAGSKDGNGVSALMISIYYGKPEITKMLRARIHNLGFFEACALGDLTSMEAALQVNPTLLNAFSPDGFSGLGFAAFFGHLPIAQRLLQIGAIVDQPSANGLAVTPLGSAAAGNHLELTTLLLANNANPNAQQNGGFTPLHSACQNGSVQMVKLLLEADAQTNMKTAEGKLPSDYLDGENADQILEMLLN